MKIMKFFFPLMLLGILACSRDVSFDSDEMTLQEWTLSQRQKQSSHSKTWFYMTSSDFFHQEKAIETTLSRGDVTLQKVERIPDNASGTWLIYTPDSLPIEFPGVFLRGDTVFIDSDTVAIHEHFFFTLIPTGVNNMYHELIIAGSDANPVSLYDFLNANIYFPERWLVYTRGDVRLPSLKAVTKESLKDYPTFPKESIYAEWIQKIRQSSIPSITAEAFEAYLTHESMPLILDSLVTFFWFEPTKEEPVYLISDITEWNVAPENQMTRIPETHIHYYQTFLHPEARCEYQYRIENTVKRDYLNPWYTGNGYFSQSVVTMPNHTPYREITTPPLVFLSEKETFKTEKGNTIHVILPPGYRQTSTRYRVLYLLNSNANLFTIQTLMENLMVMGKIPPMITVFAGNEFLEELVSSIDSRYRTLAAPEYRMMSAWSGESRKMVIKQSLAHTYFLFSPLNYPTISYEKRDKITWWIETGMYDLPKAKNITKTLQETYPKDVSFYSFPGGHHPVEWHRALFRRLNETF
ncbi:MAG: hypothetical protein PHS99_01980 [Candidatus Marinimicrobia bacterium]|nr:hypothetical protein [Candidatus Neomarinimicrobiota bacterium]